MTCCVTKAIPIHFIDGRCHIKQMKSGKSFFNQSRTVYIIPYHATGYYYSQDHTNRQTDTYIPTFADKTTSRNPARTLSLKTVQNRQILKWIVKRLKINRQSDYGPIPLVWLTSLLIIYLLGIVMAVVCTNEQGNPL